MITRAPLVPATLEVKVPWLEIQGHDRWDAGFFQTHFRRNERRLRRRVEERPERWWREPDAMPDSGRRLLLAGPAPHGPEGAVESYLASLLYSARRWPGKRYSA